MISQSTVESVAQAVITTVGALLTAVITYRRGKPDRSDFPGRHDVAMGAGDLPLVKLQIPAADIPSVDDGSWRLKVIGNLAGGVAFFLACAYCMVRFIETDLANYWWFAAGITLEIPAGRLLGSFIGMRQVGLDRARRHTQSVEVEGELRVVVDRTNEILKKMKLRIRSLDFGDGSATVEGSAQDAPKKLIVAITTKGSVSQVDVTSEIQPSASSYRRNVAQVTRFIEELTGVRVYVPGWDRDGRQAATESERAPSTS